MHFYDQKRLYKLQQYISCFFSYAKWVFARLGWCSLLPLAQCCQVLYEVLSIKKKKIYQMIALLEKKSWNYYGPGKYSMVFLCFVAQFHIIFIFFIGFHLCIGCQKPWMIHEIKCKAPKYLLYKKLIFMKTLAPLWTAYMVVCKNSWWLNMMYQMWGHAMLRKKTGLIIQSRHFSDFFVVRLQCSAENRSEKFYGVLAALSSSWGVNPT